MHGTVALVTGAAGGIGAAVVRALGARGATVAALDRDEGELRALVEEGAAEGRNVAAFPVDVSDGAGVEAAVEAVETRLGPVEHLVNGAGVLHTGAVKDFPDEDWADMFAVNATGVFHTSRAAVNRMAARSRGAIVTLASNAASTPRAEMAAYSASKAAATMFTKSLGLEVAQYGTRCNVVAPGSTETPMLTSMWSDENGPRRTIDGHAEAFRVGIPLRKLATPEEVANAVVFLLSEQAAHITLHELTVDGGASLGA